MAELSYTKILKFYANWCGPCKTVSERIPEEFKQYIQDINIEDEPTVAVQHKVMGLPTLIKLDKDGNEVARKVGDFSVQSLKEWLAA